jgi:murein DD-endopeptidase MepM/ murein hydrolase activator NlpD
MKSITQTSIFLFFWIFILPIVTLAIDTTTSGRILDSFKNQQEAILFETAPVSLSGANDILMSEYTMNGLDSLKKRLALVTQAYTLKKNIVVERKQSLEEALHVLDDAINDAAQEIQNLQWEIHQKDEKIQQLQTLSINLKQKIHEHRQIILAYLSNIYAEGNMIFNTEWEIDVMKNMILSEKNADFFISDVAYKSLIAELGQKFVNEYRDLIKQYYVTSVDIGDEIQQLTGLKKKLVIRIENISIQKWEREKLLEITKWQEKKFEEYINAQVQAENTVSEAWKVAELNYNDGLDKLLKKSGCVNNYENVANIEKCVNIRLYFDAEKQLRQTEFATGTMNIFNWPVPGNRISTYFRDPNYYNILGSQHDAIDIPTPQSTDVKAAFDGYVHYILPPTPGGYSYLVLKHRDGYMTVYGHLSEISVKQYDFVRAGDIIAKSGWAPGTPGAGPMTTWSHLHLEVWKNKEPVDPLRYLSLADMKFENLPTRYEDKFITDIIERSWDSVNVNKYQKKFVIRWDTEMDRQKYLLSKYATFDFSSWDMWVDTAIDAQIDPSFLMCVGLAETTLWNHLKTPYNVGNIGNTDSGDTSIFASPQEWLLWMSKTFNNKYLGKYTKLSELSRWGNETGTIYASSNANWHNNIVKCVSALKWRFIEDDFAFRIVQK